MAKKSKPKPKSKSKHSWKHYFVVVLLSLTLKIPLMIIFSQVAFLGYLLYFQLPSPFNFIVSVALVSIGASMTLIGLWEIWASLTNRLYNLGHCPFCSSSREPQQILSVQDGVGKGSH